MEGWMDKKKKKSETQVYADYRRLPISALKTQVSKWKMEDDIPSKQKPKGAILLSDKVYFKPKRVTRNKEGYYIMIKGWESQKAIRIVNICIASIRASKHIKKIITDLKGEKKHK